MAEWRNFEAGTVPHVSTFAFHEHRERAPHLEQPGHRKRLLTAAEFVGRADKLNRRRHLGTHITEVSDLGCGDGGLLSLLLDDDHIDAWGYDFAPANQAGWEERGVAAAPLDVFGKDRDDVHLGDVAVMTEVLEHLADPHEVVRWVGQHCPFVVASSPHDEFPGNIDVCHAWAWDRAGYRALFEQAGYHLLRHVDVTRFQVVLAWKHL